MFATILLVAALLAGAPHTEPRATDTGTVAGRDKDERNISDKEKATATETSPVVTDHAIRAGGKELRYTATAGLLPIVNDAGETEAQIFFIAYTANNPTLDRRRPLLFLFNGGPGASSVWLHLGTAGPRRVLMLADGSMPPPPFNLVDNESSWLESADLVFIDPVGTGFSRAVKPDLTAKFTTVRGDIDAMGRFIRLYLARQQRWGSPLFLVGESYGAFRAAGLSEYLVEHGIALNGIIMVSSIMNLQTTSFDQGNDLPYQLFLPSYAATAWYHKKLAPPLQSDLNGTLSAAELWSSTDYAAALAKGDRLTKEERRSVIDKLAGFTGLDATFIDSRNLRVDARSFSRELLRDRGELTGIMDSRFTAANPEPAASSGFDPTVTTIRPPFTATFNEYVRQELGFRSDMEYFTLGGGIGHWDWETKNRYADTSDNLRNTLVKNPHMKLFVASGCFDLATPHFATDYTLAHLGLPRLPAGIITVRRYRAGHMMYLDSSSRADLTRDVATFIRDALTP